MKNDHFVKHFSIDIVFIYTSKMFSIVPPVLTSKLTSGLSARSWNERTKGGLTGAKT